MFDIAMSPTWDLVPNGTGGLATVSDLACDLQDANYRLQLNDPDHRLWAIGANLEDLIGQPNSAATGKAGEAMITTALNCDGRFGGGTTVTSVPVSANEIEFVVGLPSSIYASAAAVVTTVVQLEN